MSTKITLITPKIAEAMLKKNTHNRNLNLNHVSFLAEEMLSGRWKENGEAIKLSHTKLIDGQHRLSACVSSGKSFWSLVVDELDEDVFYTLDTGKKRTASDSLKIEGLSNTSLLAAGARIVTIYEQGLMKQRRPQSIGKIKETIGQNPELIEICDTFKPGQMRGLIAGGQLVAFKFLFSKFDPDLASEFIAGLTDGANLDVGSPISTLRGLLIRNMTSKRKLPSIYISAYLIIAFNAFAKGRTLKSLRWDSTKSFPKIIGSMK